MRRRYGYRERLIVSGVYFGVIEMRSYILTEAEKKALQEYLDGGEYTAWLSTTLARYRQHLKTYESNLQLLHEAETKRAATSQKKQL